MTGAHAVSSAHGPLRHLFFCFPAEAARRPGYRAVFTELFKTLPAFTRLTVLANEGAAADLAEVLAASGTTHRTTVLTAPDELYFTVWAQDPFVVLSDGQGQPRIVQPDAFEPEGDDAVAPLLARHAGLDCSRTNLRFHGGHVLVGDDFVLVSRDCSGSPTAYEALLGHDRHVIFVGTDRPVPKETNRELPTGRVEVIHRAVGRTTPLVHLDLFISLAGRSADGRYRVLVGDPNAADAALNRATTDHNLADHFDDIAQQLRDEGFEVIRNPLPLTHGDGRRVVEGVSRDVRLWYFATSNNCLVQIDEAEGNQVWLPTYGHAPWAELAATDEANRAIWAGLGFETHLVGDMHVFAQRLGALHCITKFLER